MTLHNIFDLWAFYVPLDVNHFYQYKIDFAA